MSDISSTGITKCCVALGYGTTCRKNVLGRVVVPVMPGATIRACPVPDGEAQLGEQVAALRTTLGRGEPAVDHDEASPIPLALVLQLTTELPPSAVGDRSIQAPFRGDIPAWSVCGAGGRCRSTLHVEVLDHNPVVVTDQASAGAVQEIGPSGTNLAVGTRHLRLRLGPVVGPLTTTSHAPLVARQVGGPAVQVTRIGDPSTVRSDGEVLHTQVDPDHAARRLGHLEGWDVHSERHIPPAIGFTRHDDHSRIEGSGVHLVPTPHEPQRCAGLGKFQLTAAHAERTAREVRRLASSTRFEARMTSPPRKEVGEGGVLMTQHLLQRYRRHFRQKCQLGRPLPRRQRRIALPVGDATALSLPGTLPIGERPVPHKTHAPERSRQDSSLPRVRVCPALVRRLHIPTITRSVTMRDSNDTMTACWSTSTALCGFRITSQPRSRGVFWRIH